MDAQFVMFKENGERKEFALRNQTTVVTTYCHHTWGICPRAPGAAVNASYFRGQYGVICSIGDA